MAHAQSLPLSTLNVAELGLDVSSYRYQETVNDAFFMANEGNKVGLAGAFTQPLAQGWFWGADARQAHGNVNYSSASSGSKGNNPDIITEARITGGRDFPFESFVLAPYFGLGYRSLYNDLRGATTTAASGYRRLSQYTYMPLGLIHRMRAGAGARLSTALEYDLLLEGRQQSFLSDATTGSNDPVNMQRQGHGVRLTFSYETDHWMAGLYAHYWSLGDSDQALQTINGNSSGLVMEPKNTTQEMGVTFRLRFN